MKKLNNSETTNSLFQPFKNERDSLGRLLRNSRSDGNLTRIPQRNFKSYNKIDWSLLSKIPKNCIKIF